MSRDTPGADALGFWWRDRQIRQSVARMTLSLHGVPATVTVSAAWLPLPDEEPAAAVVAFDPAAPDSLQFLPEDR